MPGRKIPLINDQIYHVYNRGINHQPTFLTRKDYQRAIEALKYYRFSDLPLRLSEFLLLPTNKQSQILEILEKSKPLVKIISFCLMPNHFHLVIKQEKENGIAKFLGNFQNSYTRYFNFKHQRDGSLFLDQFKAVRIETGEQLLHVSRYVHLNPHTGFVVKNFEELLNYKNSSLPEYVSKEECWVDQKLVLNHFKLKEDYLKFVFDQANYQRTLKEIQHLTMENP